MWSCGPRLLRAVSPYLVDCSACAGLLVLVIGALRVRWDPTLPNVDRILYGTLFLPAVACLVFGYRPTGSRVLAWLEGLSARIDALPSDARRRYVVSSIALVTLGHAIGTYLRHASFRTGMDLAIYANACRGMLFSTMKGDVWILADHFEPMLIVFAPLCRVFPPAVTLLTIQIMCFGVGALGVHALARHEGWKPALAWLVALLYLGFAGNVSQAYHDFHLITLAMGIVPWLWWMLQTRRYEWVLALSLLYLGLKESAALSLIGLGAYLVLRRQDDDDRGRTRRLGALLMVLGALSFVIVMEVIFPFFRGGEASVYFGKYYGHLGRSLAEFLATIATRPQDIMRTLLHPWKLRYVAGVLAPFLAFPLVRPVYLLPIAPALLINMLSNEWPLVSRSFHYESEIYPALFAMAVIAFKAPRVRAAWLAVMLLVFTVPGIFGVARLHGPTLDQRRLHAQLEAHVPRHKAIAAPQRIAAHLTDRERLYMFDYVGMEEDWRRADVVVLGYHGDEMGWYSRGVFEKELLPKMLPSLRLVYEDPADRRFRLYEVQR